MLVTNLPISRANHAIFTTCRSFAQLKELARNWKTKKKGMEERKDAAT